MACRRVPPGFESLATSRPRVLSTNVGSSWGPQRQGSCRAGDGTDLPWRSAVSSQRAGT